MIVFLCLPCFGGVEFAVRPGEKAQSGRLLIGFRPGVNPAAVLRQLAPGATSKPVIPESNIHVITLPPAMRAGISSVLARSPLVSYVEPDRIRNSLALSPNDPAYAQQWALQNIQALAAWGLLPGQFLTAAGAGTNRIKVAVLDTGADCTHPDFMNAGGASADSAAGGQLSFALSKAYYPTAASPAACPWQDDHGHGTHTAGIIAASANNSVGVAGAAYPVQLMIYKVMDQSGRGDDGAISQAIVDAANNGASVISMSLGGPGYSQTFQNAINYAWSKNVLVVAAAGNSGSSTLFYPGGANHAIGVAATDSSDNWASFSNYGNQVAVGAPGVDILSTVPTYPSTNGLLNYGSLSGTSMSTPYVAALGGMLFAASPGVAAAGVRMRIESSADNTNSGGASGQYLGYGRVNFSRAVSGSLRSSTQGGVVGQVIDASTEWPIGGAVVSVAGQSITTDYTGLFRFNGITAGSWQLTVNHPSYPALAMNVNVVAGSDTESLAALGGSPSQINGKVTDHGSAVAGAVVEAVSNGLITSSAVTGPDGSYNLYVQAGTYNVTASAIYYVSGSAGPVTAPVNGSSTANLNLPAMGAIGGTISFGSGSPAAGAAVTITGPQDTSATADSNGHFSTIGLAPGDYTVDASYSGLTDVQSTVNVAVDNLAIANLQFAGSTANPNFAPIRVRAGGGAVTDASGNVWSADTGFSGGYTYADSNPIRNTNTPALYQAQRYNVGAPLEYRFAVPNGSYSVTLKFAETYFSSPGQRVANIVINGQTVQQNFDIVQAAGGPDLAVDETYSVNVTNGVIGIQLTSVVQNPEINALQIMASASANQNPAAFSPIYVRAGGPSYIDSTRMTWAADNSYSGGFTYMISAPIANTPDSALYQAERFSPGAPLTYSFAVPNGTYHVTLKFSENYFSQPGARVQNILINNAMVMSNFDICSVAGGPRAAVDEVFPVTVTNGVIAIQFQPVVQNPKVDAIAITF